MTTASETRAGVLSGSRKERAFPAKEDPGLRRKGTKNAKCARRPMACGPARTGCHSHHHRMLDKGPKKEEHVEEANEADPSIVVKGSTAIEGEPSERTYTATPEQNLCQ